MDVVVLRLVVRSLHLGYPCPLRFDANSPSYPQSIRGWRDSSIRALIDAPMGRHWTMDDSSPPRCHSNPNEIQPCVESSIIIIEIHNFVHDWWSLPILLTIHLALLPSSLAPAWPLWRPGYPSSSCPYRDAVQALFHRWLCPPHSSLLRNCDSNETSLLEPCTPGFR